MHLALALFASDWTTDVREVARAVEGEGFESLFVAEHTHIPTSRETPHPSGAELPEEYKRTLDPFVSMTAAVSVTTTLKVGTGVCLVVERDPIVLAKEVATLDFVSGGRLLFGVGAGWNAEEMADHGIAFGDRWEVLRERMHLMRSLWYDDVASYSGVHASLSPSWQYPKPVQSPLPVLVGGDGPTSMRHAVEYGTSWMPTPSRQKFAERHQRLTEFAEAAGKPTPPVTMYFVKPDRARLDHYEELGIERVVMMLPPEGDTVAAVKDMAAKLKS